MKANDLGLSIYQMRLLTCAEIVRNGTGPFNMKHWQCGTTHCAVGDYCVAGVSDMRLAPSAWASSLVLPTLGNLQGFEAVEAHFKLSPTATLMLFGAEMNEGRQRKEVADRIEGFALRKHKDALAAIRTDVDLATIV